MKHKTAAPHMGPLLHISLVMVMRWDLTALSELSVFLPAQVPRNPQAEQQLNSLCV